MTRCSARAEAWHDLGNFLCAAMVIALQFTEALKDLLEAMMMAHVPVSFRHGSWADAQPS